MIFAIFMLIKAHQKIPNKKFLFPLKKILKKIVIVTQMLFNKTRESLILFKELLLNKFPKIKMIVGKDKI